MITNLILSLFQTIKTHSGKVQKNVETPPNSAPRLHNDLKMMTIPNQASKLYKTFHIQLQHHSNLLISNLVTKTKKKMVQRTVILKKKN